MNKQDNPYYNIVQMIKSNQESKESFVIGTVVNNNPLLISLNGIQLDRQDFKINAILVEEVKVKFNASDVPLTDKNSNTVLYDINTDMDFTIELEDYFKTGNKVLLLVSQNQQNIVLLCKVV